MENTTQPIGANPSVDDHTYPANKNKATVISPGILFLIILAGIAFWYNGFSTSQQEKGPVHYHLISHSIPKPRVGLLKTIPHGSNRDATHVYKIGTIVEEPYKDKTLALALLNYGGGGALTSFVTFAYFVSDDMGTPIAWDPNFYQDNIGFPQFKESLGLSDNIRTSLDFLPIELMPVKDPAPGRVETSDGKAFFSVYSPGIHFLDATTTPVAYTNLGWPIERYIDSNDSPLNTLQPYIYVLDLPFGIGVSLTPEPPFIKSNRSVPQLSWEIGTTPVSAYAYGQYTFVQWRFCYPGISLERFRSELIKSGETNNGDSIYETGFEKNPSVYGCLYQRATSPGRSPGGNIIAPSIDKAAVSYEDFVKSHPLFFWENPFGDFVPFMRADIRLESPDLAS